VVILYTTGFAIQKLYVLSTQCIYVFCVDLRTNSDYFRIQHWLVSITETQCVYCAVRADFYFLWRCDPTRVMASSFLRFLDHTQRRATVGKTPQDEWSARRRDLYLTTHNTHNRQTCMLRVGFEPTISAGERPQTYSLNIIDVDFVLQSVDCSSVISFYSIILQLLGVFPHILYASSLILHFSWFDRIEMNLVGPLDIPAFLSSLGAYFRHNLISADSPIVRWRVPIVTPQYYRLQCHLSIIPTNVPPPCTVVAMLDCQYTVNFPSFQTRPDDMQTVRCLVVCQRSHPVNWHISTVSRDLEMRVVLLICVPTIFVGANITSQVIRSCL
jgi:hypothetical protein